MKLSSTSDAVRDAQRLKKKGILLDDELDNCRSILEENVTDSEYKHFILLVLGKARENIGHKRKRKNVYINLVEESDGVNDPQYTVNHKADAEELNRMNKGHSYLMPGRKNTGKRVVEEEDTNNEYQNFQRPISGKAKISESFKRRRGNVYIDLVEDSDGVNDPQYGVNHKADAVEFIGMDKGHLYQMPGRRYNREKENLCGKRGDPGRCREKDKVCSRVYLQKPDKGKNVIGEDGGTNRNTVLHQEPSQKNNRLRQYQNGHVDQARSVGKYKEQMGAKFKGRIMVKVEFKVNKKATVMEDNENFHQGRRNNRVARNHCERVDRQPGKRVGQRELIKVGQGKHGLSHDKAVFENYSLKKEPDDGVKTRLHTEKVHNKIRSAKTAFGEDVGKLMKGQGDHVLSRQQTTFGKKSVKIEPADVVTTRLHTEEVHNKIRSVKTAFGKDVGKLKKGQGDRVLSHHQAAFGNYSVKIEPDDVVKTRLHTEEVHNKIRSAKTAFGKDVVEGQRKLMKVGHGNYSVKIEPDEGVKTRQHTEKGKRKILPEVEILDGTAFIKGMPSPFVPSTTDTDLHNPDSPTLDEFRKELLEVLKKPYDRKEYKQHREAIRIGSFFKYYPDLGKKLAVHRYKRKKCLTIVRGFFFWLKNVCREGAFPPWKDRQCLAIEPGSP